MEYGLVLEEVPVHLLGPAVVPLSKSVLLKIPNRSPIVALAPKIIMWKYSSKVLQHCNLVEYWNSRVNVPTVKE